MPLIKLLLLAVIKKMLPAYQEMLNYLNSWNRINLNESKQRSLKIMSYVKLFKRPKGHLLIEIAIELPSWTSSEL